MGWGNSGRSSSSSSTRKGRRGGGGSAAADKPKQPQRGLGVAQLEKIRLQSEMAEYFNPRRTGGLNLMTYGERGDARYGEFQTPIIRSPGSSNIYGASHYAAHPSITLPLFEPAELFQESAGLTRHNDRSRSADSTSMNSDDPQEVDLELKL
ncbi:hypothetical protein GUJ93_ZPchr0007g4032 [Zizania palustris]|uniref:Uncharacterized protein n=1 Tax=Zizania palustris TaxID=103762 RepID=A0A8J5VR45_ZIZPA|nr:hypothetical protein GUJ93_ZPchr0007g4032 [Zizania palustris]